MSAQWSQAKAGNDVSQKSAPVVNDLTPEQRAAAESAFGDNSPDELTADSLQVGDALERGETPVLKKSPTKKGGDDAADPGSEKKKPAKAAKEKSEDGWEADEDKPKGEAEEEPEEATDEEEPTEESEEQAETTDEEESTEEPKDEESSEETEEEESEKKTDPKAKGTDEEEDEGDGPEPSRMRVRRSNYSSDFDWKVAQITRTGVSTEDAIAQVRKMPQFAKTSTAAVEDDAVPEAADLKTAETDLESKETALDEAMAAFDTEAIKTARKEVRAAQAKVDAARDSVRSAKAEKTTVDGSIARAIEEFPESQDPNSKMGLAVAGFFANLPKNDPLWRNPDRAFIGAKRVAAILGVKGKTEAAASSPSKTPVKEPAKKPQKVSKVRGSARTSTTAATPAKALDAELAKAMGRNANLLATIS